MGTWNLSWQGANGRRTHHSHGKWDSESEIVASHATRRERFVISEIEKVRGLSWYDRAENLEATMTQQDQGPSGLRRVYLTTEVVASHDATPGCSGCVGSGPHTHTEACRVRLEKHWLTMKQFPQFVILLLHIFFQPELVVSSRHVYIASSLFVVTCAR